jgi:hypothetical protein
MSAMNAIDTTYLRVAKVQTFAGPQPLTNATGFFFLHDDFLYLVTARHVVIQEAEEHRPSRLQLSLHSDPTDLQRRSDLSIPLYVDGVPQWFQHPRYEKEVDLVAVAINDPRVLSNAVLAFSQEDTWNMDNVMPLGQDVLILGFPLGFHDTLHNLPLVRSATIASSFPHPFKGEPYFLTDGRMHRGMSGSPVVVRSAGPTEFFGGRPPEWKLIGIHTSALDVSDRNPELDERLALNTTWYASLILDMLPVRERGADGRDEAGRALRET